MVYGDRPINSDGRSEPILPFSLSVNIGWASKHFPCAPSYVPAEMSSVSRTADSFSRGAIMGKIRPPMANIWAFPESGSLHNKGACMLGVEKEQILAANQCSGPAYGYGWGWSAVRLCSESKHCHVESPHPGS